MKRMMLMVAAGLIMASCAVGYAQQKGGNAASEVSPGDQMKDNGGAAPGSRGASESSPGDRKKDAGSTSGRGASKFSPGDRAKDAK